MKIVLDTNILISALVKDSFIRAIIKLSGHDFYFPKEALKEIYKYKEFILEKTGLSNDNFEELLNGLLKRVILIEQLDINPHLSRAKDIMDKIDPKDTIFIACALSTPESIIWSEDNHFQRQNKVKALKTKDLFGI